MPVSKKEKKNADTWPDKAAPLGGQRASGDAGRPRATTGPGFLEIVSGPGPLNALYVSCNLIPRRSARCPDRRVIYANSWASGSVRAAGIGPPGFLRAPDATAVPFISFVVAASSDTRRDNPYVDEKD